MGHDRARLPPTLRSERPGMGATEAARLGTNPFGECGDRRMEPAFLDSVEPAFQLLLGQDLVDL